MKLPILLSLLNLTAVCLPSGAPAWATPGDLDWVRTSLWLGKGLDFRKPEC